MSKFSRGHTAAAKLTPSQVQEIRVLYNKGHTQGSLARQFKVSVVQVGRICRGEAWQGYQQEPHPDEIEHSQAILDSAPVIPLDAETIERLRKITESMAEKDPTMPPAGVDPFDAVFNKGEDK